MAPTNNTSDESHQQLLASLDIAPLRRPFRNPNWKAAQRRNKNVKQIIAEASRKEASAATPQSNSGASTPYVPGTGAIAPDGTPNQTSSHVNGMSGPTNIARAAQSLATLVLERNLQNGMSSSGPIATYTNIESAPSLHPAHQKHYCDITGLVAPYTDPKTRLRYHNKEVFEVVRNLGQGVPEKYLEARGAHVVLK